MWFLLEALLEVGSILHRHGEADPDQGRYVSARSGLPQRRYTLSQELWNYLQAYAKKHRLRGNGFGYGLVGPADATRTLSARYYKDGSEILIDRGRGRTPRRLTPRECARLMGFDGPQRAFRIPQTVSDTHAYMQFGNAVVVPVVEEIARIMMPCVARLKASEAAETRLAA